MAKPSGKDSSSNKYVVLRIYPKQRFANFFLTFLVLIFISALIAFNAIKLHHSHDIGVGITGLIIGLLLCLLPLSEQWAYAPWQDAPRKLEQETRD